MKTPKVWTQHKLITTYATDQTKSLYVGSDKNFWTPVWCTTVIAVKVAPQPKLSPQKLSRAVKSKPKLKVNDFNYCV